MSKLCCCLYYVPSFFSFFYGRYVLTNFDNKMLPFTLVSYLEYVFLLIQLGLWVMLWNRHPFLGTKSVAIGPQAEP